MTKLNVKFTGKTYLKPDSKTGLMRDMFVYQVTGTEEALKRYEEAQGPLCVIDPVLKHLWFTGTPVGDTGSITVDHDNRVFADTGMLKMQAAMVRNLGGNLGDAIAKLYAAQAVGVSGTHTVPEKEDFDEV